VSRVRVVIADDHPLVRRGLRQLVEAAGGYQVVAEADTGLAALAALREHRPAIAIVDVSMPELDGLEVLAQTRTWPDPPAVVLLTMHDEYAERALAGGAAGYLLKDTAESDVVACLAAVAAGGRYLSPGLPVRPAPGGGVEPTDTLAALTSAERRILRLLAGFKTSREIAEVLCVSPRTVQNHRANMCAKLGLRGSKALLQFALDHADEL
jgi:DNA-binding NarL/FixJ family response regulator